MNTLLVTLMGIQTLMIVAIVYYYAEKVDRLNIDLDVLDAEYDAIYSAYCNVSELARQYKELTGKATDEADLYKEAYDSEHNAIHYELDKNEELEANNDDLREIISQLDRENQILEIRLKALKDENIALRNVQPIQYEYSSWNPDAWKSIPEPLTKDEWQAKWDSNYASQNRAGRWEEVNIPLGDTPYINPYNNPLGDNRITDLFESMENFE
jgi:hypothetical protein